MLLVAGWFQWIFTAPALALTTWHEDSDHSYDIHMINFTITTIVKISNHQANHLALVFQPNVTQSPISGFETKFRFFTQSLGDCDHLTNGWSLKSYIMTTNKSPNCIFVLTLRIHDRGALFWPGRLETKTELSSFEFNTSAPSGQGKIWLVQDNLVLSHTRHDIRVLSWF